MIHDRQHAVAVDPGDAEVVEQFLRVEQLVLSGVLVTHHHADHIGGLSELAGRHTVPVWGPASITGVTNPVTDGEQIVLPHWAEHFAVMAVPGHTLDHLAYYGATGLFCGDTLFAVGCGRLFEGSPQQMWQSLSRLAALPEATPVYCTHEYTLANERFAHVVEPHNDALLARMKADQALRDLGKPTLPSRIGLELATNPFLRCREPEVVAAVTQMAGVCGDEIAVFAALRAWKDRF